MCLECVEESVTTSRDEQVRGDGRVRLERYRRR